VVRRRVEQARHSISPPLVYLMIVIYASLFASVVASLLYTNHVAQQNERKWCHLLTTLDSSYRRTPPRTESGQQVAADIHGLLANLHCGGKH
jgi:hypothetical protein